MQYLQRASVLLWYCMGYCMGFIEFAEDDGFKVGDLGTIPGTANEVHLHHSVFAATTQQMPTWQEPYVHASVCVCVCERTTIVKERR